MALDVYKDWLGIPEEFRPPDHYQLLRLVQFEDDEDKIRANYKKLNAHVRKYATGQYTIESQELLNELAKGMLCLTDPQRKREYDEGLGREFAEEAEAGRKPLGRLLVDQKKITRDQLREAEQFASQRGLSMRDAVVQMKLADSATATKALASELGFSFVDLSELSPDTAVLGVVPANTVKRNTVLPLFVDEDVLLVACVDEPTHELEDELRLIYGVPVRPVIAEPQQIKQGIEAYYSAEAIKSRQAAEAAPAADKGDGKKPQKAKVKKADAKPQQKAVPLTPEEIKQRKQVGYMIMMWGVIGSVLISQFIPYFGRHTNPLVTYLPVILIAPGVVFYVTQIYWKKR